jgi:hypothetical protein
MTTEGSTLLAHAEFLSGKNVSESKPGPRSGQKLVLRRVKETQAAPADSTIYL